jgi:hypothetical protein
MKIVPFTVQGKEIVPAAAFVQNNSFPDLVPNVDFQDALIRFGCTLVIPMVMLAIDKYLIIYTAPIMAYLFISSIARFCVVKYIWCRYIKHQPVPVLAKYGQNVDYPEQSL